MATSKATTQQATLGETSSNKTLINGSRVGIIGGSIAGCAAAIALERLGCHVTVFERSSGVLRDRGSGIAIPIPLRDELIEHGYLPVDYAHCTLEGRRWVAADGTSAGRDIWQIAGPMVTNNWGVLWRNLRDRVNDSNYVDGRRVVNIGTEGAATTVQLDDGTVHEFDILFGADGYRSEVRDRFAAARPAFSGYVLWRGNFAEADLTDRQEWDRIHETGEWLSVGFEGGHGVIYPIPDFDQDGSPGNRRVNWAIYAPTPTGIEIDGPMSIPPGEVGDDAYRQLQALLDQFPPSTRPLFASPQDQVSIQPIFDTTVPSYVHGRVALIGDAGTVARPHTATGATKALQDARLLETLGAEHTSWGPLLADYDADRTRLGNELVELGRRIGRDQVVHTPPWLDMSPSDFETWTANTLSGATNYLYGDANKAEAQLVE